MIFLCFLLLVVSTSATDCLERLMSEMTCYVSSGTVNPTANSVTVKSCYRFSLALGTEPELTLIKWASCMKQ